MYNNKSSSDSKNISSNELQSNMNDIPEFKPNSTTEDSLSELRDDIEDDKSSFSTQNLNESSFDILDNRILTNDSISDEEVENNRVHLANSSSNKSFVEELVKAACIDSSGLHEDIDDEKFFFENKEDNQKFSSETKLMYLLGYSDQEESSIDFCQYLKNKPNQTFVKRVNQNCIYEGMSL